MLTPSNFSDPDTSEEKKGDVNANHTKIDGYGPTRSVRAISWIDVASLGGAFLGENHQDDWVHAYYPQKLHFAHTPDSRRH